MQHWSNSALHAILPLSFFGKVIMVMGCTAFEVMLNFHNFTDWLPIAADHWLFVLSVKMNSRCSVSVWSSCFRAGCLTFFGFLWFHGCAYAVFVGFVVWALGRLVIAMASAYCLVSFVVALTCITVSIAWHLLAAWTMFLFTLAFCSEPRDP